MINSGVSLYSGQAYVFVYNHVNVAGYSFFLVLKVIDFLNNLFGNNAFFFFFFFWYWQWFLDWKRWVEKMPLQQGLLLTNTENK